MTGLLANNTQAICSPSSGGSFLLRRPPGEPWAGRRLYVRYRPDGRDGRAGFTWLGYRFSG
jgi:hypothetical protein